MTDIVPMDSTMFVSGGFANIGGVDRRYVAEPEIATAQATAWNGPAA